MAERITRKNKNLESELPLTISAQYGLIDQTEFFDKQVASRDVSNYYLLVKGDFAYNKSYSNGYPWGAVKRLDKYNMGVLSTLYIVFTPTDIETEFLTQYYESTYWHNEVSQHCAEGARNHGLLNIAISDFFETKLIIPTDISEQTAIGNFFRTLDDTITLYQRKLDSLRELKRGYLQVMFPREGEKVPRVRFERFSGEWAVRKLGEVAEIVGGGTPDTTKPEYWNGNIDWYSPTEIGKAISVNSSQRKITIRGLEQSSAKILPANKTILFTSRAGIGDMAILKKTPLQIKVFNHLL